MLSFTLICPFRNVFHLHFSSLFSASQLSKQNIQRMLLCLTDVHLNLPKKLLSKVNTFESITYGIDLLTFSSSKTINDLVHPHFLETYLINNSYLKWWRIKKEDVKILKHLVTYVVYTPSEHSNKYPSG